MSRIDKTLVSMDWVDHFGNVSQRMLLRVASDHCLLSVEVGGVHKGCCSFKFENMRLKDKGKWLWKYGNEVTHLWRRVIATKYGKGGGVLKWVGDNPLKILCPELYECSNNREACIYDVLCLSVKPKDAAETPKQRAIVPQKGVGELEQDENKFDHGKVDTKEDIGVLAMEITKEQGKHKIDHGKIKTKEDVDVTTIDQFEKGFKLDIPLVIDFIIPNEFNDTMRNKDSFLLVLPKVIEELVQVLGLKVLILTL
uniref:Uncharacterized protein n=1 Tax=Quercus lobata TaxID=97700 RepID=A0A7N2MG37_QUELO